MKQDLYHVKTVVKEYHGCKDVTFIWFCSDNREQRDYASLIANYDPSDRDVLYAEDAINELFTEGEANRLKEYLDRSHGSEGPTTIVKANLPMDMNIMPLRGMPVGGGTSFINVYEESEYDLPFQAVAYYDLRGCELIDEPGETFRHYLTLVTRDADGKIDVRRETQKEAREREVAFAAKIEDIDIDKYYVPDQGDRARHVADQVSGRLRDALRGGMTVEQACQWADEYGSPKIVFRSDFSEDEAVTAMWWAVFNSEMRKHWEGDYAAFDDRD
jgi:hypothetical protein